MKLPEYDEIHFWQLTQSEFELSELLGHTGWLTQDESARLRRFQYPRHKRQLLLGRILLRSVLSRYMPAVTPQQWRFSYNQHGKPEIESSLLDTELFFNLSHSGDRIVLAVARQREIGVDIEFNKRSRRVDRLVERFFSAVECRELLLLPGPQRLPRFYQLWTLKEAFIKAMGMGLALPLDSFSFSFSDTGPIVFSVHDSARIDAADGCLFLQVDCGEDYACAIAINGMTGNSAPGIFGWRMTALNEFCDAPVPVLAAIQG